MSTETIEGDKFFNFSATVAAGPPSASLIGVTAASSTSGTMKIVDAKGNIIINTMAMTAGQFVRLPCKYIGPLVITVGGTLDATLFYKL